MDDHHAGNTVSVEIDAPADRLYDLVSDITRMGRLSPECVGGRWLGSPGRPAAGARFVGFNRRGLVWWPTLNRVVAAEPGREFAFDTTTSGIRWRYRFEPAGDGTRVTESREVPGARPLVARAFATVALGGAEAHEDELREGMRATLQRLKDLAEGRTGTDAP